MYIFLIENDLTLDDLFFEPSKKEIAYFIPFFSF